MPASVKGILCDFDYNRKTAWIKVEGIRAVVIVRCFKNTKFTKADIVDEIEIQVNGRGSPKVIGLWKNV